MFKHILLHRNGQAAFILTVFIALLLAHLQRGQVTDVLGGGGTNICFHSVSGQTLLRTIMNVTSSIDNVRAFIKSKFMSREIFGLSGSIDSVLGDKSSLLYRKFYAFYVQKMGILNQPLCIRQMYFISSIHRFYFIQVVLYKLLF